MSEAGHPDPARVNARTVEWPVCILLVGLTGAGKSTVGRELSARIGYRFVDLDKEIERQSGKSISEIFREGGEAAFRVLEARATSSLHDEHEVIVATGGGWMARQDIQRSWPGSVRVWLKVAPETALRRLGQRVHTRPMLDPEGAADSLKRLLETRRAAYAEAECEVDTVARSPDEVVDEMLKQLRGIRLTGGA
jgi:shikimate kinase